MSTEQVPGRSWTAPVAERVDPPEVAAERESLDAWLDYHRATLQLKCAGLTPEQLCLRPVQPSGLALLGLVRHLVEVERWWFRTVFAGEQVTDEFCTEDRPEADFEDLDPATAERDLGIYRDELVLARAATAGHDLDERCSDPRNGRVMDLRWIYVHMVEEYARHNGHADLLRECVDGTTGE